MGYLCLILIPNVLDKTEDDADREAQLLEMRLTLTEERNAVMVPSAGSGSHTCAQVQGAQDG